jgi:hypothetical protein
MCGRSCWSWRPARRRRPGTIRDCAVLVACCCGLALVAESSLLAGSDLRFTGDHRFVAGDAGHISDALPQTCGRWPSPTPKNNWDQLCLAHSCLPDLGSLWRIIAGEAHRAGVRKRERTVAVGMSWERQSDHHPLISLILISPMAHVYCQSMGHVFRYLGRWWPEY